MMHNDDNVDPDDNLITLKDEEIIGKAVTIIDDDFNSENPIPIDDVFPTRYLTNNPIQSLL